MRARIMSKVERGTIAIGFVHEALECVRARGLDANELLARSGISPELLNRRQARVSANHYAVLWRLIARSIDDEFFGLDSHPMRSGSFVLLCRALLDSPNLERGLNRALRFLRLILDDIEGRLVIDGEIAHILVVDRPANAPPKRAFVYGTFLLIVLGLACWLVGRRIPVRAASFRGPEPSFSNEWRIMFSPELAFEQPVSGISFPAAYLALPNHQTERTMAQFLHQAPANLLVKYRNDTSHAARIRRHLREVAPAQWPDFDTLAREFHASPSTLRRRLENEGQSYRAILDDVRRDLAIALLSHSEKSIMEIAAELGFAEPSAFHRAFKKWTGTRPGEYRFNATSRA